MCHSSPKVTSMNDKQVRAEAIVPAILDLAAKHGTVLPHQKDPGTLVRLDQWEVKILPNHRWSIARDYQERVARRLIEQRRWLTIELRWRGKLMFVVNLHDGRIDIHYFRPGQWEKRFGSDPGDDTVIHEPWNDPIGPHAEDQLEMRAKDLKLPPRSTGPATGDELRNPTMPQRSRSSAPTVVRSGYTVALSGRRVPGF